MTKIKIFSVIILSAVFLISCGGRKKQEGQGTIQIAGSDSEVNMVQNLAEIYMQNFPEIAIAVTGGGSGTGIASLINNQIDIANSSRLMSEEEIQQAKNNGVEPIAIPFAIDGIAVIVNKELPIKELTIEQISRIYQGTATNWNEFGGPDMQITVYGRQSNSGTYVFFREFVVKGEYTPNKRNMNGTAQIVEAVKSDASAIGYVGIGYASDENGNEAEGLSVVKVKKDEFSEAYSPLNEENIKNGNYAITRLLYQYTNGMPEGRILDFIRFELSQEGQEIVAKAGFYPLGQDVLSDLRNKGIIE